MNTEHESLPPEVGAQRFENVYQPEDFPDDALQARADILWSEKATSEHKKEARKFLEKALGLEREKLVEARQKNYEAQVTEARRRVRMLESFLSYD